MKKSNKGVRYGTVFFIVVATMILTAIATYFYVSRMVENLGRNQQIYSKLNKVNDLVNKNFILPIDSVSGTDAIADGIVEGYINSLGDPYSYYLNETNYGLSTSAAGSTSADIGIRPAFNKSTGGILVDFVRHNSPAKEAGLETGDVIISVDGRNVTDVGYRNAVAMLSGAEGTDVVVSFVRGDETVPQTLTVTRAKFDPKTVEWRLLESGIGYLHINEFGDLTDSEFIAAVESLRNTGARGFIIDVRFNSGGNEESMRKILDEIMASGIMYSVKQLASEDLETYSSDEAHMKEKIIVLQNYETSDVAEVFAGALQETKTATLVGDTSRGKGVGQRTIPLSDGTAIHISTYAYVTPNGNEFNETGIVPDVLVALPEEKVQGFGSLAASDDDQLQAALVLMRSLLGTN